MKNTTLALIIILGTIILGTYLFSGIGSSSDNISDSGTGEVQKVVLGMKGYNYYPSVVRVKVNQPVSITMDSSVVGCGRSFMIRDLGLSKRFSSSSDSLNFTPSKKGTYVFSCTMGMYTGTLIVE